MRTGVVLIVHGTYAGELLDAARPMVGALEVAVVEVAPGAARQEIVTRVATAADRQRREGGVLLMADLCGSTPANACLEVMAAHPGTAVVTGLSLSMLMKVATADPELDAHDLARELQRSAHRSVQLGADLLTKGANRGA